MKPSLLFTGNRIIYTALLSCTIVLTGLKVNKRQLSDLFIFFNYNYSMDKLITIESRQDLSEVSSGSGMAIIDDDIYIIGDDSPYLYQLNSDYAIKTRHLLMEGLPTEGRIPKAIKPDFESMAEEKTGSSTSLYIFGSGSKAPQRELLVVYNPHEQGSLRQYFLSDFYQRIMETGRFGREELNIEAAVIMDQRLYLFNRGNNQVFSISLPRFKAYLPNSSSATALKEIDMEVWDVPLPKVENIQAGFSGACILPGSSKIIFSATLEDTDNWIDDGEIYGTMLGILDTQQPENFSAQQMEFVKEQDGLTALEKIESISFTAFDQQDNLQLRAVADNDDGSSRIFSLLVDRKFIDRAR